MKTSPLIPRVRPFLAGLLFSLVLPAVAVSSPILEQRVAGARMELGELVPSAPNVMHGIDIGPAPSPGGSRLVSRDTIIRQVRAAGFDPSTLALEPSLRARRAGKKYTSKDLEQLITAPIELALPNGVTLVALKVSSSMTLEQVKVGPVRLPKLPKRTGVVKVAFSVEFLDGSASSKRLPVTAVVSQTEAAIQSTVSRGQKIQLTIQHGSVRISADSIALSAGDIGDEMRFRVLRTGKVLLGKLTSPSDALVREQR